MKKIYVCLILTACLMAACGKKDCSNSKRFYRWGYDDGEGLRMQNQTADCDKMKETIMSGPIHPELGETNTPLNAECYCEGFNDGLSNAKIAYPDEENSK